MKTTFVGLGLGLMISASSVMAADIKATDIGTKLTAAGSTLAASGNIPAFEGAGKPASGWDGSKSRLDFWKYGNEKPLFVINASNVSQYAANLAPGQVQMFSAIPGYEMAVYPTHRTCDAPDFVMKNSVKNLASENVVADGVGVDGAVYPGIPFPGTNDGLEAIWNHLMRYNGVGVDAEFTTVVSPRPGASNFIETTTHTTIYSPLNAPGSVKREDMDNVYQAGFVRFIKPAAMSGQAMVQKAMFKASSETFMYFPGQRRVRRMPSYSYDAPMLGYENQMMIDSSFGFNGNPDRFDWKMIGEKEIYVPYNSFSMYDNNEQLDAVVDPSSIKSGVRRYELHKVYVVEATIKEGMRHMSPKRTFYLDADTYLAVLADDYDEQGSLWKMREGFPMPVWELDGACAMFPYSSYDLTTGRYFIDMLVAGNKKPYSFSKDVSGNQFFNLDFYTQDNLRSVSR